METWMRKWMDVEVDSWDVEVESDVQKERVRE